MSSAQPADATPDRTAAGGTAPGPSNDITLRRIADALRGIRFGSVLAIVQDGVVVQIERTEKTRYSR